MANEKLTDKASLSSFDDADLIHVVDVSDTSGDAAGTSKKGLWSLVKSTLKTYFDTLYKPILIEDATVTGAYNVDWSKDTFNLTLTGATTWTDTNLPTSGTNTKVLTMYVTGNFGITFPSNWETNKTGTYDGTVLNQIVIEYVKSGVYWMAINQA